MKKHRLIKLATFLFAIHILNISVDPIDPNPYWAPRNLCVNEMESITEIIFEKVLHVKNAFAENKHDNNNKGTLVLNHFNEVLYYQTFSVLIPVVNSRLLHFKQTKSLCEQHSVDTLTPPPKA